MEAVICDPLRFIFRLRGFQLNTLLIFLWLFLFSPSRPLSLSLSFFRVALDILAFAKHFPALSLSLFGYHCKRLLLFLSFSVARIYMYQWMLVAPFNFRTKWICNSFVCNLEAKTSCHVCAAVCVMWLLQTQTTQRVYYMVVGENTVLVFFLSIEIHSWNWWRFSMRHRMPRNSKISASLKRALLFCLCLVSFVIARIPRKFDALFRLSLDSKSLFSCLRMVLGLVTEPELAKRNQKIA